MLHRPCMLSLHVIVLQRAVVRLLSMLQRLACTPQHRIGSVQSVFQGMGGRSQIHLARVGAWRHVMAHRGIQGAAAVPSCANLLLSQMVAAWHPASLHRYLAVAWPGDRTPVQTCQILAAVRCKTCSMPGTQLISAYQVPGRPGRNRMQSAGPVLHRHMDVSWLYAASPMTYGPGKPSKLCSMLAHCSGGLSKSARHSQQSAGHLVTGE